MSNNSHEEEMEEFIKDFEKIVNRLEKVAPVLQGREHLRDKVNIFMNAYNQRELTRATKQLFWATLVLAVASIIQLINSVYGREVATNTISQLIDIGSLILIVVVILAILQAAFDLFGKIWRFTKNLFKNKQ